MDIKTIFLNGDLKKEVYMKQLKGFCYDQSNQLLSKLNKSIYGLKQASNQWYLKLHDVISFYGFMDNIMNVYTSRLMGVSSFS
jgi:hypothetical protein